jgi:hypothetical protein
MFQTEIVGTANQIHPVMQCLHFFGGVTAASAQIPQSLSQSAIEPLDVAGIKHIPAPALGQVIGHICQHPSQQLSADLHHLFASGVFDHLPDGQARPSHQTGSAQFFELGRLSESSEDGFWVSAPAIRDDQQVAQGSGAALDQFHQFLSQASVPIRAGYPTQPEPSFNHNHHRQPDYFSSSLSPDFIGLDVAQFQAGLLHQLFLHLLGMLSSPHKPVTDGTLIQTISLDDSLHRTTIAEQGSDNNEKFSWFSDTLKSSATFGAESFAATNAPKTRAGAAMYRNITLTDLSKLRTIRIRAELPSNVHLFSLCRHKLRLPDERIFFKLLV